jgi:putative glutamine amidotransferase
VSRPLIGITVGPDAGRPGFFQLREDYLRSVEQAGGLPVVLAPGEAADAAELLDGIDGLLLSGGADVDPALFGEQPHQKLGRVTRARDDFELALTREALAQDVPLLAICRGQQVLNVAAGGTLVQDIPSQLAGSIDHDPDTPRSAVAHTVRVADGTRLHAILGEPRVEVNSFHHQSVKDLGRGLIATAWSEPDSVVEGIESPKHRFVVGVQWHPEGFWRERRFQALFAAHAEACR